MPKVEGYYYKEDTSGRIAIEAETPCEGYVTVTYVEAGKKAIVMQVPELLWLPLVRDYLNAPASKTKAP